jgi:hypothetical protein
MSRRARRFVFSSSSSFESFSGYFRVFFFFFAATDVGHTAAS